MDLGVDWGGGRRTVQIMKRLFSTITFGLALGLACQGADTLATYWGTWTLGTNSGPVSASFRSDHTVRIVRYDNTNSLERVESVTGFFTQGKTGLRSFSVQTSTNAYVGTAANGVVKGTFRHFVTRESGRLFCDPTFPDLDP